jgi:hypothetical protein
MTALQWSIVVCASVPVALVCAASLTNLARPTAEEAESFAALHGIPPTIDGVELGRRYLSRSRRYRLLGALTGALLGASLGPGWVVLALPGWFGGVLAAELFRLGPRRKARTTARTASLLPRTAGRYTPARLARHSRVLAAACVAVSVAVVLLGEGAVIPAVVVAAVGVVTLALAEACQRAVAARARPALPPDLEAADEAIRRLGATSIGYAASGVLSLLIALMLIFTWHRLGLLGPLLSLLPFGWAFALGAEERRAFEPMTRGSRRRPATGGGSA